MQFTTVIRPAAKQHISCLTQSKLKTENKERNLKLGKERNTGQKQSNEKEYKEREQKAKKKLKEGNAS